MKEKVLVKFPESLSQTAPRALSFYPQLQKVFIEFRFVKTGIFPYASRPSLSFLYSSKAKRRYIIFLAETDKAGNDDILFHNLPLNAQIGILGHEIAHIVRYNYSTRSEIIRDGIFYFLPSFRRSYERETDKIAIQHGLGVYLKEYSSYVHGYIGRTGKLAWVKKYYLSPEEINEEMKKYRFYRDR